MSPKKGAGGVKGGEGEGVRGKESAKWREEEGVKEGEDGVEEGKVQHTH